MFYDSNGPACGVGYFRNDEQPGINNANNNPGWTGAGYGVTYKSCWFGRTSIHENAHNQGAAQYSAPNSTGNGAHCNEFNDILCYVDGGNRNQTMIACPSGAPAVGTYWYDCGWNTYFDSAPEPGEWLATHWNIGSSVNRFIEFGTAATPPETTIDSGVDGPTTIPAATFTFSANEPAATFECSLAAPGAATFAVCTSPQAYTGVPDGSYEFRVRASAGGNVDTTPALKTFSVDTTAPETQIDSAPSGAIGLAEASVSFSTATAEPDPTFECDVDAAGFEPCTSPLQVGPLDDGAHTVAVRATDALGNQDASPAQAAFAVDMVAPETAMNSGPKPLVKVKKRARVSFGFASDEAAVGFECSLDAATFASCASPQLYKGVRRGSHQFLVRAVDAAGNLDATPASRVFKVKKKRRR